MSDILDFDETFLDDYENDLEIDEMEERSRRRPARPRTPSGQGLYRNRPSNNAVTQAQLQTALTRVGQQIKEGSTATQQLAARVNTVIDKLDREIAGRKKADAEQKKAVGNSSMGMMLPLLLMQGGTDVSEKDGEKRQKLTTRKLSTTNPDGTTATRDAIVAVKADGSPDDKDAEVITQNTKFKSSDMMLPLVMMMGMGGMSGGSGDNNMMMMMVLVLMMQKK